MKTVEDRIGDLESRMDDIKDTLDFLKKFVEKSGKVEPAEQKQPKKPTLWEKYNSLTKVEQSKIEDIMRNFDFEKVHDVMQYLDWHWVKVGVPTVEDIKAEAKRLLVDACYEKTTVACGGLRATYEATPGSEEGDEFIQLEFILTDCEGFDEDEN